MSPSLVQDAGALIELTCRHVELLASRRGSLRRAMRTGHTSTTA